MEIENFLAYLDKVKTYENGWSALCPCHDDKHNSLSIAETEDGKILLKCHAGCQAEDILKVLGLSWEDIFPKQLQNGKRNKITLEALALDKGMPVPFLQSLGVEEKKNYLRISYFLEDGTLAPRQRKRTAFSAKEGSFWEKGSGKPVPYGLWKHEEARKAGFIIFVEGESDCWSAWKHGFPALGFPGADMAQKLKIDYIEGINKIYVVKEPDKGGDTFVKGVRKRLSQIGYKGILFVIRMVEHKDLNELDQRSFAFKDKLIELINNKAVPLSLVDSQVTVNYGNLIPELPKPEEKTVLELMQQAIANKENFAVLAPQGAGKSYANSYIAVQELKKGRSVLLFSRSHDELNQLGKTIKSLLEEEYISEDHFYHLRGNYEKENPVWEVVPDIRPLIVVAPHAYLKFKGDTPYHYAVTDMIFNQQFGCNPLVLIDEMSSFLENCFLSKPLGSRESRKTMFGEELVIRNTLCPLSTFSGNCLNCNGNMFLTLRRGSGGMLEYKLLSQRHEKDKIKKESCKLKYIGWHLGCDDKTMRVYPILAPKNWKKRTWATGNQDEVQQKLTLQNWYDDVVTRLIEPTLVFFYPYNLETDKIIERPLNDEELKNTKRKIVPPRQVCGVPILQGWDLAILQKISQHAQICLTGPSASETERYVLKQAINLNKENYYLAKTPYVIFEKILILALEKDLNSNGIEIKKLLKALTSKSKLLCFLPTYAEAKKVERKISEDIKTMYYDGEQKVSNAPIQGTSIDFDLCISCIHGPLGQGINLGQFKLAIVNTNNERPKFLFARRPEVKTIHDYIVDDVAEKARQAALRILRLTPKESSKMPRVILFYGRNANEVSQRVKEELCKVGHKIKCVQSKDCTQYAQEWSLKWLDQETNELENIAVEKYIQKEIIEKSKQEIKECIEENVKVPTWREINRKSRMIRELTGQRREEIKEWFEEYIRKIKTETKLQKVLDKINKHLKKHTDSTWRDIYNKFNLARKTQEEREWIKERIKI